MITVGLVQADIKPHNVDANLKHYEELLLDKIQEPVNLLVFPEMYHCGFSEDLVQHAEPMNGRSVAFCIRQPNISVVMWWPHCLSV